MMDAASFENKLNELGCSHSSKGERLITLASQTQKLRHQLKGKVAGIQKAILIPIIIIFLTGCLPDRHPLPLYCQKINENAPVKYIDKIDSKGAAFGSTTYGQCEMDNKKDGYPITIKLNTFAYSQGQILQHELVHRFDALMYDNHYQTREKFINELQEELHRGYDVEDLPAIVEQIQQDKDFLKKYYAWKYLNGDYQNNK